MNRKEGYCDMQRYRDTCNRQNRRYYGKTAIYKPTPWSDQDDDLVLAHCMTDHALSEKIGHSVKAIQIRRYRLKKLEEIKNEDL